MTHQEIEEKDIVEAYLRGRLSENDRQAFEEHFFACDECFAQVQETETFASGIRQAAESGVLPAEREEPAGMLAGWLRPAFAFSVAAVVVLAVATAWLAMVQVPGLRREADARQALLERERQRNTEFQQQLALNRPPAAEANLPLVMLEASRAAEVNRITVPTGANRLALWMELGPEARSSSFRLEIRNPSNQVVATIDGLVKNKYGALAASLPAERLPAGTYTARLFATGGPLTAEYRLEVRR
jgi:hypothetical protein